MYGKAVTVVSIHLVVRDPERACAWYSSVLGAAETSRVVLPGGQVLTIEMRLGDTVIAVAGEIPDMGIVSPRTLGGTYLAVHVAVADAGAVWSGAMQAGATVFEPLHDAFWGERTGQFIDPDGHRWAVDQHLRDVPPDEVARLAAAAFAPQADQEA